MPSFSVSRTVFARPATIWHNVSGVMSWSDRLKTVDGIEALDGKVLSVGASFRVEQPGLKPAVWKVTQVDPGKGFEWVSEVPGMTMTANHHITPGEGATSVLTLTFDFSGPLGAIVGHLYGRKTREFLGSEVETLASLSEALDTSKSWGTAIHRNNRPL